MDLKRCAKCKELKPLSTSKKRVASWCNQCCSKANAKRQKLRRIARLGSPVQPIGDRRCKVCSVTKPMTEFYKDNGSVSGFRTYCKACSTKEAYRGRLKAVFGMTTKQYNILLRMQDNACAICSTPFTKTPNVDHDHETGEIRALLCSPCNHGLGNFKDDSNRLAMASAYIQLFHRRRGKGIKPWGDERNG